MGTTARGYDAEALAPPQRLTGAGTARRTQRASRPRRSARRRQAQTAVAAPSGPLHRLLDRADRIDWRYKLQLTVGFCLLIMVPMYVFRERMMALGEWGYLGAFMINGISSASIILPAPGGAVIAIMAQKFNPILIGIAAGIGGSIGGASAYVVGAVNASGARKSRWFRWIDRGMARFGGLIVFTFALIPILPGDLASLSAGAVRYPLRKYFLYNGVGSVIKMTAMAYVGADALAWLERIVTDWARTAV